MTKKTTKPNPFHMPCKQGFLEFYLETFGTEYYFKGIDGKRLNDIINALKFKIGNVEYTEERFVELFKVFIKGCYELSQNDRSFKRLKDQYNINIIFYLFNDAFTKIKSRAEQTKARYSKFGQGMPDDSAADEQFKDVI